MLECSQHDEQGGSVLDDLKHYKRTDTFALMTEEDAAAFFIAVLAVGLLADYLGLLA